MLTSPRALGAILSAVFVSSSLALPARAEAPALASPAIPDVVVLHNGGMLRGTIVELVPDQAVSIMLPTGETRMIPMMDVAFAGPSNAAPWNRPSAEAAPQAPAFPQEKEAEGEKVEPFITVHAERARLKLVGKKPNLTVHVKSGTAALSVQGKATSLQSDAYTSICTAPCEATLPVGAHELGVSGPGKSVVGIEEPVSITGPGTLEASYQSKTGTRTAGYLVFFGGAGGGAALMFSGDVGSTSNLVAGGALMFGGMLLGLHLARTPDRATVAFIPGVATPPSDPTAPARDMQSASLFDTPGFTVVGTF